MIQTIRVAYLYCVALVSCQKKKKKPTAKQNSGELCFRIYWGASLVAQTVKSPRAMQKTRVQSLGWEDTLEKDVATHSSIPAWRIPVNRGGYGPWDRKESDTTEQLAHAWWKSVMWCHMVVSLVGAVAHRPCVQTCSEHVRAKCQEKLFFPWETDPLLPTSPPSTSRYRDTTVCLWAWKISFLLLL